jgi:hypothetical protein
LWGTNFGAEDRVRKVSDRIEAKGKYGEEMRDTLFLGVRGM